ncbi:Rrp15p-domain-containing protein [Mollisia scopiformis]|uniref:Rrp15p-domain-containing protein n=1 Tax=Mollisia scopiformis TaxID=149040 RepID=A0A194XCT0_MOLSC|nr:Rrp15p-domain-containing protein [Mollisia scopiformis]KUJ17562.1 Rrp15p-domain-containing protein [Mollisia scopiformis]
MPGPISKKRKVEDGMKGKVSRPVKKFKKQTDYYSSSDEEETTSQDFKAVNLQESDEEDANVTDLVAAEAEDNDESPIEDDVEEVTDASNSNSESGSEEEDEDDDNPNLIRKRKRNDPEAFATSMSKILGSKLSTSKRSDPVLSRSATAIQASKEITDLALEKKARHKMRAEKREALEKGRVKDVLGASTAFDAANGRGEGPSVQETMELEKRLRKTAQRGVVKLFNAVRAAQIKGEEAARGARETGLVGQGRREERVNEMSKKGFLDLIAGGGGSLKAGAIEEA